jgi:subfamily B ATP-binding cassette protein MsbA
VGIGWGIVKNTHFRWLLGQLWIHRAYLILSLVLTFSSAAVFLIMPRWASVVIQEDIPHREMAPIIWHLLAGIAIFLTGSFLGLARAYTTSIFLHTLGAETRMRIFNHILRISPRQLNFAHGGDVLSRVCSDVDLFQGSLGSIFAQLIPSGILAICFSAAMAWFSPLLLALVLLSLSPLVFVSSFFGERLYHTTHASQESIARLVNRFEEALGGAREIKSFGEEPRVLRRFAVLNAENLRLHILRDRMDSLHPLCTSLIVAVAAALLLGSSVLMTNYGWITSANLTGFFVCLVLAYGPLQDATLASTRLQQFRAVMERLDLILNVEPENDGERELPKGSARGALSFERLHFSYSERRFAITNLNLEIPAGQMVALVGASGAGKSTLLDFIPRFLVAQEGGVLLDGIDVREFKLSDLRREIGIVPQEPILFEATLEENLRFGSEHATDEEVRRAAIAANVDEFAQRMPRGYATRIEFRGSNLSVGQRQRVALARALIKAPRLLLFDEPTSALDAMSEDLVRTAMKRASVGRTTLIVAHRLSTVRDADRVLVISEGQIVEDGSHEQLMAMGGHYWAMYSAQSAHPEAKLIRLPRHRHG